MESSVGYVSVALSRYYRTCFVRQVYAILVIGQ